MKDQLITLDTAKLAKEKGFNIHCKYVPTQSLLQKWIRDKHGYHIEISLSDSIDNYDADLYVMGGEMRCLTKHSQKNNPSFEMALESIIIKALNLINNK